MGFPNEAQQAAVVTALIDFGRSLTQRSPDETMRMAPDPRANALVTTDPFAFLLGVIVDYGIAAERAWSFPYLLKERLGSLTPSYLAAFPELVAAAVGRPPKLHRFVATVPRWIVDAARRVLSDYGGDAGRVWNDGPTAVQVQRRLEAFKGIGQKKAAMAVEILERGFGVPLRAMEGSDIAFDVHLRRVFLRAGLAERDERTLMIDAARKLYPVRPGALDEPAWHIGRTWCHPVNPQCPACVLTGVCPKLIDRAERVHGIV